MAQCLAKTKDGTPCRVSAREGQKYCHIHRRERILRITLSASAIGLFLLAVLSVFADLTGILSFLGLKSPVLLNAEPSLTPAPTLLPVTATLPFPSATPTSTLTPIPSLFSQPLITDVLSGVDLPGYGKISSLVRDSEGKITLFIRYPNGDLDFVESTDKGKTWNKPTLIDNIPPPGGPGVAAAVDSADRIHIVWGHGPEAGDANYGLIEHSELIKTEVVGTGVFAREIAVDSANHPHVIWSNVDIYHTTFDGQKWLAPERAVKGGWHPDILINAKDELFLFMNNGAFYPTPGVSVYEKDNIGGIWNKAIKVSTSPFWSGAAAAALDSYDNIYLVWIGSSTEGGGQDQVFFSRFVDGEWQSPFPIGDLNSSAGSTGAESPAIGFDANDVLYVFWRGLNANKRPVIFVRALVTETSQIPNVSWGWSEPIQLDNPAASDVWWPSVADVRPDHRIEGVDVVWTASTGTTSTIEFSHVTYP